MGYGNAQAERRRTAFNTTNLQQWEVRTEADAGPGPEVRPVIVPLSPVASGLLLVLEWIGEMNPADWPGERAVRGDLQRLRSTVSGAAKGHAGRAAFSYSGGGAVGSVVVATGPSYME